MQISTERALTSLLDVAGVEGSFLVDSAGSLAAWHIPAEVEEQLLDEGGAKLARLRQAFAVAGKELDFATVRFANYLLCLKASELGLICVLTRPQADLSALRLQLRLVLAQLLSPREGSS
jgi:hypothetical protein